MRERRKREKGQVVFDYNVLVKKLSEKQEDGRKYKNQTLLKMKKGPITYTTELGTRFYKEHPFQLVGKEEADHLLGFKENNFVYFVVASLDDLEDFYAYD